MTNEEAIRTLKANYPDACFEQLREAVDAAIEALKAQEVSNNSPKLDSDSGDTISRQAACDAVCKAGCDSVFCGVECPEVMALRNLQPVHSEVLACGEGELIAQPETHEEHTETHACDLISRQAAISHVDDVPYIKEHPNVGLLWKAWIESLPPAQPERKKGKWIKHIDDLFPAESTIECSECHHEQPLTIDDNYCPNCGSFNGGENEV